jgi:anhydro-N-acetylmuramic acid kinase
MHRDKNPTCSPNFKPKFLLMIYKAIGIMSGSSLDGLDIAYVHFQETAGRWNGEIVAAACYPYSDEWSNKLKNAITASAINYQLLHTEYGHYIGEQVNRFIEAYSLHHKVDLIGSHGHTTFHSPANRMTAQLGDGAAIAASTELPVVSDLRALDIAFGGQGAPIVPIGEKLLLSDYELLLNLGGIANLSVKQEDKYLAFDVCAANRVLNMLAAMTGKTYDENGEMAASGNVSASLLNELNELDYYKQTYPKSLANDFGTDSVYPLIMKYNLPVNDALHTYVEHIVRQVRNAILQLTNDKNNRVTLKLLATGGGALNSYLVNQLTHTLKEINIETIIPESTLINYKEAMIMALIAVLRWREEYNVLATVTGAKRNSIGGALWLGTEA